MRRLPFHRPPVDFETIRLGRALHTLGRAVGADVGTRADVIRRLERGR